MEPLGSSTLLALASTSSLPALRTSTSTEPAGTSW
jgi:hypothetical protein